MSRALPILFVLILFFSCREKKGVSESDLTITILDIAEVNRIELGKSLRIISHCSPKIIGLDLLMPNDSLNVDTILVRELTRLKNTVKCVAVYNYNEEMNSWDSLNFSNDKFETSFEGFSNFTMTDDSVLVPELPMRQHYRDRQFFAFSYLIAENSFGVKSKFKSYTDGDFVFNIDDFGNHFKVITPTDLASGNFKTEDFKDKIVIMGYVGNYKDTFYLDEKKRNKISGAEIQACFIRQLINN